MRHRLALGGVLVLASIASGCASPSSTASAGERFLSTYVTSDGRVIRYNQGSDIVSEGQAYGVLIAELVGEPDMARRIWLWSKAHLSLPNGLLAWHANSQGVPESSQSAADADVLMAYGLLRYEGAQKESMHRAGRALAAAVLRNEAVKLSSGVPIIVAGPWAVSTATVDPSYFMPTIFDAIGRMTGEGAWSKSAAVAVTLVGKLTDGGKSLPPDWATLKGGTLVATPTPGTSGSPLYGFDAVRLPLWFASSWNRSARRLAAAWWSEILLKRQEPGLLPLSLAGAAQDAALSPISLISAAATAAAAGDGARASSLRAKARSAAKKHPTYYGDAWVAIGEALAQGLIGSCPP